MLGKIDKYEWVDMGSSYVPNEVSCAILWAQLERCQDITTSRLANYQLYERGLADLRASGALRYASIPEECKHNAHIFFIIMDSAEERVFYEAELKKGASTPSHTTYRCTARLQDGGSVGPAATFPILSGLLRGCCACRSGWGSKGRRSSTSSRACTSWQGRTLGEHSQPSR